MMPTLVAVAGLPGSGKSTYVCRYAREHDCIAFSDITQDGWRDWPMLAMSLRLGYDAIIDSATFTAEAGRLALAERLAAIGTAVDVQWRYFANDPAACLSNVLHDADRRPDRELAGRIKALLRRSRSYVIPKGAVVYPVLRPSLFGVPIRAEWTVEVVN